MIDSEIRSLVKDRIMHILFNKQELLIQRNTDLFVLKLNEILNKSCVMYRHFTYYFKSSFLVPIPITKRLGIVPETHIKEAMELLDLRTDLKDTKIIIDNYICNALNICKSETDIVDIFPNEFELALHPNTGLRPKNYILDFKEAHQKEFVIMQEQYAVSILL